MTTTTSSKLVERRLNDFRHRCGKDGEAALQLAYHAAFPVALNPELLHFLRINFFLDPPEQLPYTVEFEFLTSGLCREIDAELYEIEPEIRNVLLHKLMRRKDALQRIRDVATLLWEYVEYHSPWADRVELERAQQLTALNFLDRVKAKQWLDEAEANANQVGRAEREWFVAMRQEIDQLLDIRETSLPDIPSMNLSGQQREQLQIALIDAFPTKASQEQMLLFELDKNLIAIAGEGSLQEIVFKLIQAADSQGWVEDLVRAACDSNPRNQLLKAIAETLLSNHELETPSNISQKQSNQMRKILILAALTDRLRLDREIREIEEAIKRAVKRDSFEVKIRTAVRPQDIRRAIAEEKPFIVHFCGHGMEDGSLLLEDDGGNRKPVLPTGLAALFKLHADYVKCVLLNACYSALPAEAISQHINYVIGMNLPIEDRGAIVFAQGFYDGLGYYNSDSQDVVQRAFNEGLVAIQMENLLQGQIPVLKKKIRQAELKSN